MHRVSVALLAAACIAGLSQAASAQPASWTGYYVGVNVGYSWGRSATSLPYVDTGSGAILSSSSPSFNMDGVIGGGQLGYNRQFNNWVLGVEADIQASAQRGNGVGICAGGSAAPNLNSACAPGHIGDTTPFDVPAFAITTALNQKLEWFGTVRGRVGHTFIIPTVVFYATGGLAYGEIDTNGAVTGVNITGPQGANTVFLTPGAGAFSHSTIKVGWTAGAGFEGVISGRWSGKVEYLYIDLGKVSGSFVTPIVANSGAFVTARYSSHITDHILRLGINYKFSGG